MAKLQLISLVCHRTEDSTGADETYLLANGKRIWGPNSMNDNDTENLSGLPKINFTSKVRIDLYDQDTGWFDNDDHLGRLYIRSNLLGKGEREHKFTGDGARYTLTYKVIGDSVAPPPPPPKHYELQLISLVCHRTEDLTGADETYLLANGKRIWGPNSMNDNDTENLSGLSRIHFHTKVRIDLYDQDAGWFDNDDHLGRTYARATQAGKGEQEYRFNGDGARYTLTYVVIKKT